MHHQRTGSVGLWWLTIQASAICSTDVSSTMTSSWGGRLSLIFTRYAFPPMYPHMFWWLITSETCAWFLWLVWILAIFFTGEIRICYLYYVGGIFHSPIFSEVYINNLPVSCHRILKPLGRTTYCDCHHLEVIHLDISTLKGDAGFNSCLFRLLSLDFLKCWRGSLNVLTGEPSLPQRDLASWNGQNVAVHWDMNFCVEVPNVPYNVWKHTAWKLWGVWRC